LALGFDPKGARPALRHVHLLGGGLVEGWKGSMRIDRMLISCLLKF